MIIINDRRRLKRRSPFIRPLKLVKACPNEKCWVHHQTLFGDQWVYRLATFLGAVWSCLVVFDQQLKTFLLFSCLMGDVLFVWTAVSNGVSNMFGARMRPTLAQQLVSTVWSDLIKHVLTVWPLTSTSACLIAKQYLMMFDHQTFPI